MQPRLSGALPGLRRYFETYPFICLEQKTSKAIGLRDAALWATVANALPTYLDGDGLASYFPPRAEDAAARQRPAHRLRARGRARSRLRAAAARRATRMLDGLAAFVEGRIERRFWSPQSRPRRAQARRASKRCRATAARSRGMLGSIDDHAQPVAHRRGDRLAGHPAPRATAFPQQAARLEEAQQILRARLTYAGTTLRFSNEDDDFWWWLMDSADANAARLILAVLDDPAWRDDLPRLVVGSLGRQQRGAWLTTTANLWGALALDKFSAKFESGR